MYSIEVAIMVGAIYIAYIQLSSILFIYNNLMSFLCFITLYFSIFVIDFLEFVSPLVHRIERVGLSGWLEHALFVNIADFKPRHTIISMGSRQWMRTRNRLSECLKASFPLKIVDFSFDNVVSFESISNKRSTLVYTERSTAGQLVNGSNRICNSFGCEYNCVRLCSLYIVDFQRIWHFLKFFEAHGSRLHIRRQIIGNFVHFFWD